MLWHPFFIFPYLFFSNDADNIFTNIIWENDMKNKFLSFLLLFSVLLNLFSNVASADENVCSWYIKRNGNERPRFPQEAEDLSDFNCYYIDDTASKNSEKILYLTFDAGYENGNISKILDVLKEEDVPAAFFVLDNIILKNTDLVTRMADEGHLVCNHTKNHRNLSRATKEDISSDLGALEKIYYEKTGREMEKFFRFPEGKYSLEATKTVCELGYTTVFWSFGYEDWDNGKQMPKEKAMKKILDNTHDGAIILLHPTSATNAEIMSTLITRWKEMGYKFGTLYELVERSKK